MEARGQSSDICILQGLLWAFRSSRFMNLTSFNCFCKRWGWRSLEIVNFNQHISWVELLCVVVKGKLHLSQSRLFCCFVLLESCTTSAWGQTGNYWSVALRNSSRGHFGCSFTNTIGNDHGHIGRMCTQFACMSLSVCNLNEHLNHFFCLSKPFTVFLVKIIKFTH